MNIINRRDKNGRVPIHGAASLGHVQTCRILLEKGLFPDEVDNLLQTPLHLASSNGQTKCAALLIDNGANVNAIDENEKTPLILAAGNTKNYLFIQLNYYNYSEL